LPGEDAAEYEAAQLVVLVADDMWKLDRLARIEKGITLGRIAELLGMTQTAGKAGRTANALMALRACDYLRPWTWTRT
jgi:hypothetical protein